MPLSSTSFRPLPPLAVLLLLGACVSTGKLRDGETAYRLGQYAVATEMLREEYADERNPALKAEKAWQLARSFDALGRPGEAAEWYGRAHAEGFGPDALWYQAQQLKRLEDYEGAIAALRAYLDEAPEYRSEINREIAACRRAASALTGEHYYAVRRLDALNGRGADYGPVWLDARTLLFTSEREGVQGAETDNWTGGRYVDVFAARRQGGGWTEPVPWAPGANGDYHDATPTFNPAGDELVQTQCGTADKGRDDACRLLLRFRDADGSWSPGEELLLFGDSVNVGQPSWAADGLRLYFAASGDPEGYGGSDLYYVQLSGAGWGSPINLGPTINTAGNEAFPWSAPDGTLYFASDGHPGMGGLDVYATRQTDRKWSRPEALGYPVNSGADDFGLVLDPRPSPHPDTLLSGVFSSARAEGSGGDDLYAFVLKKAPPPPPAYRLTGRVVEALPGADTASGEGVPAYRPLPAATVALADLSAGQDQGSLDTDREARFAAWLAAATDYRVSASLDGYFTRSETVSTNGLPETPGDTFTVETTIVLERIPDRNTEISLENIYYDFDDTTLRAESFPELDKLVRLLAENPTLRVEIGSHTDSRGRTEYNDRLSAGRANSVVAYLERKGIAPVRMEARGYGERRLLNRCADGVECTEEEHQVNRRTTFKVLGEVELESLPPEQIRTDPRRRGR